MGLKTVKILISAVLMFAVMAMIFVFSGQDGDTSSNTSNSVAEYVIDILGIEVPEGHTPSTVPIIFGLSIRKIAHISIYFLLGLTSFLFSASIFGIKPFKFTTLLIALTALIICTAYALFDELHQSFVGGRTASFGDVGIDGIGFVAAVVVSLAVYLTAKKLKSKKTDKNV